MSGSLGLLPPALQPGLAPVAHYDAQVGQARLAVGRGRGWGWKLPIPRSPNAPPPSPTLPHKGGGSRSSLPLQPRATRPQGVFHPRACLPRSCLFSHHSRRESAAEAGPLEFLTLLAQAPRSVSPRAGLRRLHSSAVYRHGFESARPLMLAMWRCRGTVQITAPGSAVQGTEIGDPQLGQQYCPSSPCQILAGMTRVRLCEIGVPREVSSNRPRRPPACQYRSMTENHFGGHFTNAAGLRPPCYGAYAHKRSDGLYYNDGE